MRRAARGERVVATLKVMVWTLLGKIAGVLRDTLIGALFGAGPLGDAYAAAQSIPQALISLMTQGFSTVTVPYFHERPDDAPRLLSALVRLVLYALVPFVLLLGLVSPLYLPHLFTGLTAVGARDAGNVSWFFTIMILPLAIAAVWTGRLNAVRRFVPLSAANLVRSLSTLILIVLLQRLKLIGVGIAFLGGTILQLLYMLPATLPFERPTGLTWRRAYDAVRLMPSQITSSIVGQVNFLVDQAFASSLATGGLLELTFGGRFLELPVSLFGNSLATVLFPDFAEHAQSQDHEGLVRAVDRALYLTWVATVPIAAMLIGLSRPAVAVVYGYGRFTEAAITATAAIVAAYALSLVFRTMQLFVLRAFYAYKNTAILARLSVASMILNTVLDYVLMHLMGAAGIALGTTIVGGLYFVASLYLLERLLLHRHAIPLRPYLTSLIASLPIAPLGWLAAGLPFVHGRLWQLALILVAAPLLVALFIALLGLIGGARGRWAIRLLGRALGLSAAVGQS